MAAVFWKSTFKHALHVPSEDFYKYFLWYFEQPELPDGEKVLQYLVGAPARRDRLLKLFEYFPQHENWLEDMCTLCKQPWFRPFDDAKLILGVGEFAVDATLQIVWRKSFSEYTTLPITRAPDSEFSLESGFGHKAPTIQALVDQLEYRACKFPRHKFWKPFTAHIARLGGSSAFADVYGEDSDNVLMHIAVPVDANKLLELVSKNLRLADWARFKLRDRVSKEPVGQITDPCELEFCVSHCI